MNTVMFLLIGVIGGGFFFGLTSWFWWRGRSQSVSSLQVQALQNELTELKIKSEIWREDLQLKQEKNEFLSEEKTALRIKITEISSENAVLEQKLAEQSANFAEAQKTARLEFEKLANRLFDEKSQQFNKANQSSLAQMLNPLQTELKEFKSKIEATHTEETKQRSALEERIKGLIEQTNKVSAEANNLATALKGKPQKRGQWGEMILERILESSGLSKDREYFLQHAIKDNAGNTQFLDVLVKLPDNRDIIIDSKVSLVAYDQYCAAEHDSDEQKNALKDHINAIKLHIDQLSRKKYHEHEDSLDFTMMFVPIEPAFMLAIQGNDDLWNFAYGKNILLVSPTNLIASLKLFADLWRREWQNRNAMEIAKRGELLYDKFVGFAANFENVGSKLEDAQNAYAKSLKQLRDGQGSLVRQAEMLTELGVKSDKKLPRGMLE